MKKTDEAAKFALMLAFISHYSLPFSDIILTIKNHLFAGWQQLWRNLTSNKLHSFYIPLSVFQSSVNSQITNSLQ